MKNIFKNKLLILTCLISVNLTQAATIVVDGSDGTVADDGVCTVVEAITAANTNTASGATPGECVAGSGADVIELSQDVTLAVAAETADSNEGNTGLPYVTSTITLNGMGHILQRDENLICNSDGTVDASEFRLIRIESTGNLSLENIILSHGCTDGNAIANKFFGGTIWNDGVLSLDNTVISSGKSHFGGAIINLDTISNITNSIFVDNIASRSAGAIYNNFSTSIPLIKNSLFLDNETTDREGGALYNRGVIALIEDSSFISNHAESSGGAIYNNQAINEIVNTTFSGNSSASYGGAISNGEVLSSINNSTFINNSSGQLGGALNSSSFLTTVNNSLFSGNTSFFNNGADCFISSGSSNPPSFAGSHNLSNQDNQNCLLTMDTNLTTTTIASYEDNGCVTPLADGSCVLTHALLIGSEALDAADIMTATTLDQRGYPIENSLRDIGAFEANVDLIFINGFE